MLDTEREMGRVLEQDRLAPGREGKFLARVSYRVQGARGGSDDPGEELHEHAFADAIGPTIAVSPGLNSHEIPRRAVFCVWG